MKFFTITNVDFAQILRDFRNYGTPHSNLLHSFGNFHLAISNDREVYHLFFHCAEFYFIMEYIYKMELVQVEGDVEQFSLQMSRHFPPVHITPSKA
jgi:hypothetical protein